MTLKKKSIITGADRMPVIESGANQSHPHLTEALIREGVLMLLHMRL